MIMPSSKILAPLLVLAASALAQSGSATITSAASFPGGVDGDTLIASLIGSSNSMTTAYVGCPVGDTTCNFTPPATIVGNPTTLEMTQIFNTTFSYYYSCQMSAAGATCTESATGIMANFVTQTVGTNSLTQSTSTIVYNTWNSTNLSVQTLPLITGNPVGQILSATAGGGASVTATGTSSSDSSSGLTLVGTASSNSDSASSTASRSSSPASSSRDSSSASAASSASSTGSGSTSSSNDMTVLVPGVFTAALLGLAAVLL